MTAAVAMEQAVKASGQHMVKLVTEELGPFRRVRLPQSVEDVPRWLQEGQPAFRAIGLHSDDAYSPEILRVLDGAKRDLTLNAETRVFRARNWEHLWRGVRTALLAKLFDIPTYYGVWWLRSFDHEGRTMLQPSCASARVITTVGVNRIVDAFRNLSELETFQFVGCGSGNTAEAVGNTALVTEFTTQLNPANTRATGTRSAPSANVYQVLGTQTFAGSGGPFGVQELGLFDQAATGGGALWDRSVITLVNIANAGGLEQTYQATFPAGG
jgi:hypothetical protein